MKDRILSALSREESLEKIFDIEKLEDHEWIWINRDVFLNMCYNIGLDAEMTEIEIEAALGKIEDHEIFQILVKAFRKRNYIPIDQFQFARLELGYRPTLDIETVIFVKEAYYRKLFIHLSRQFDWMLKAMAIDTYFRMGLDYKSLREVYEELYEGNMRIIEDVFQKGEYSYLTGTWKHARKTDELYFYKSNEFFCSWAEGAVSSKFEEQIDRE
ncbi:hypothetical protein HNQ80_002363 [Anaerosolibacter carboniphilus]|uniref:Uncharacterized protein n=1 Tax=Anaerosolibacter carboniphilus TaxID=1417629 RepID=A0A841KR94_9FIRM|nr:hypothetical protein [Anaerosolibacter carboniphilus]MBB6216264.1 hypothetical protein [Anaerosolibacter carboniphilus]